MNYKITLVLVVFFVIAQLSSAESKKGKQTSKDIVNRKLNKIIKIVQGQQKTFCFLTPEQEMFNAWMICIVLELF